MKTYNLKLGNNKYEVVIKGIQADKVIAEVNGLEYVVSLEQLKNIESEKKTPTAPKKSTVVPPQMEPKKTEPITAQGPQKIICPMPGLVRAVFVKEGDVVEAGHKLMIMEAMKLENDIIAEAGGKITRVNCKEGDNLAQGELMIEIGG